MIIKLLLVIVSIIWIEYMLYKMITVTNVEMSRRKVGAVGNYLTSNFLIGIPIFIFIFALDSLTSWGTNVVWALAIIALPSIAFFYFKTEKKEKQNDRP